MTHIKRTRGQALVEMALVLPLFLIMLLGIYDFGMAFHTWSTLNQQCVSAAKKGTQRLNQLIARGVYGANTHVGIQAVRDAFWAKTADGKFTSPSPLMAKANYLTAEPVITGVGEATSTVTVSAKYKVSLITPVFGSFFGEGTAPTGEVIIGARAEMKKE